MNKGIRSIVFLLTLAVSAAANATALKVTVGPFETDVKDYPVVLRLANYEFTFEERAQLGVYTNGRKGKEIPSQLDDNLNGDSVPDELVFLVDLKKGKTMQLVVKPAKTHKNFEPRVHAEMFLKSKKPKEGFVPHTAEGKSYYIKPVTEQTFEGREDSYNQMHHHGVAFESERMAYRIYFDKKQTVDVYAKKTPRLELDACKWYPTDEQLAEGFGDDVLRVSGFIGVGACKPWNGKKMVHFDKVESRTQRIIANGPIRTICEMETRGWDGKTITTCYTMYAGHRDVMVEVRCSEQTDNLVTGVQRIGPANFYTNHKNLVASFGTAFPVNDSVKYGKETVGLAVYVPTSAKELVQDANNNMVLLEWAPTIRYFFTVVAQKELNPPARTDGEFFTFAEQWATQLEKPGTDPCAYGAYWPLVRVQPVN